MWIPSVWEDVSKLMSWLGLQSSGRVCVNSLSVWGRAQAPFLRESPHLYDTLCAKFAVFDVCYMYGVKVTIIRLWRDICRQRRLCECTPQLLYYCKKVWNAESVITKFHSNPENLSSVDIILLLKISFTSVWTSWISIYITAVTFILFWLQFQSVFFNIIF